MSDKNSTLTGDRKAVTARRLFEYIGSVINSRFSVRLWDGSVVPMGEEVDPQFAISIEDPGVIGSLLRRPTAENLLLHYVKGRFEIHGDLLDFLRMIRDKKNRRGKLRKRTLLKLATPFLFSRSRRRASLQAEHKYTAEETGRVESARNNKDFIQFHYDISNEFYRLFLGEQMCYSCAYFTNPGNSIEQAQHDKLEMICRKLRLKPGEHFLDIGCGWGGLVCHAVQHHGVMAHGVTLSQAQLDFAREKVKRLGLEDKITLELRDYMTLDGTYDKIASVGMFEHIGIANMEPYFRKIESLLNEKGLLLNHGISRRAKKSKRAVKKIRPERRLILKYIFPGSELDHVGHTCDMMEICGFEVHDVEAWREHYALTLEHWYRGMMANRDEALSHVGIEKFRMWAIYLAGGCVGFGSGSIHICQVLGSKKSKGPSGLPLTREDLYR